MFISPINALNYSRTVQKSNNNKFITNHINGDCKSDSVSFGMRDLTPKELGIFDSIAESILKGKADTLSKEQTAVLKEIQALCFEDFHDFYTSVIGYLKGTVYCGGSPIKAGDASGIRAIHKIGNKVTINDSLDNYSFPSKLVQTRSCELQLGSRLPTSMNISYFDKPQCPQISAFGSTVTFSFKLEDKTSINIEFKNNLTDKPVGIKDIPDMFPIGSLRRRKPYADHNDYISIENRRRIASHNLSE